MLALHDKAMGSCYSRPPEASQQRPVKADKVDLANNSPKEHRIKASPSSTVQAQACSGTAEPHKARRSFFTPGSLLQVHGAPQEEPPKQLGPPSSAASLSDVTRPVSATPSSSPFASMSQRAFSEQLSQAPSLETPSEAPQQSAYIAEPYIPDRAGSSMSEGQHHLGTGSGPQPVQEQPYQRVPLAAMPEHSQLSAPDPELASWDIRGPSEPAELRQHQLYSEQSDVAELMRPPLQLPPDVPDIMHVVPLSQVPHPTFLCLLPLGRSSC